MTIEWSRYQQAIFAAVGDGEGGDLVVEARAGTGKTSTAIEALYYTKEREKVLLCAFSKPVEQVLKTRAPADVEVRTLHSYGFKALRNTYGDLHVKSKNGERTRELIQDAYGDDLPFEMDRGLVKTVSACKNTLASKPEEIHAVIERFDIDPGIVPPDKVATAKIDTKVAWMEEQYLVFVKRVGELLERSKDVNGSIDFDDMIWLPVVKNLKVYQYDRVFVDESMDLNAAQHALVAKSSDNGRILMIGDPRQAIYGFRGASPESMFLPGAKKLPLPICYRCAKSIVKEAQALVPDIEPWDEAPDGIVRGVDPEALVETARPGDVILSRINAPLTKLWLSLIRNGKPAKIMGRDMGAGLASLIRKAKANTTVELLEWIQRWMDTEVARRKKRKESPREVYDKAACIIYLSEGLYTVREVLERLGQMFSDPGDTINRTARVALSTVHAAKGLEWDRAHLLTDTFRLSSLEEENILYVAITRARRELFYVGATAAEVQERRNRTTTGAGAASPALSKKDEQDEWCELIDVALRALRGHK